MRWRGVHHCERCGQPQVRERLLDAARSVLLYERELRRASTDDERARWSRAMAQQEQIVREELDRATRSREQLIDPPSPVERERPREWQPRRFASTPPPPEFLALRDALRSLRRLGPEPPPAERTAPPPELAPLLDLARRF